MAKTSAPLLPITEQRLQHFGERLRLARLRRGLTAKQVAERAGMVPMTLRGLERGGPGVTIGAYLSVMQVLGLDADLDMVAQTDTTGRALQDAKLRGARRTSTRVPSPHVAPKPLPASTKEVDWIGDDKMIRDTDLAALLTPPPKARQKKRA